MAAIWHLSAIQFYNKTEVFGVILKNCPDNLSWNKGWLKNAWNIISSYSRKPYSNQEILVSSHNRTIKTVSDKAGNFSVNFNFIIHEEITVHVPGNSDFLPIKQQYPILFKDTFSSVTVISDVDETIIMSFTKSLIKRVKTTLFKNVEERRVILFTQELYQSLITKKARFFYVSKSENNLFQVIAGFLQYNKLPEGALLLTPYLNFWRLLTSKKDKDFKLKKIRQIINKSTDKQFILIGDDSQHDIDIYTMIVEEFKFKISSIYIRQTKEKIPKKAKNKWEILKAKGVKSYYFKYNEDFSNYYHNVKTE